MPQGEPAILYMDSMKSAQDPRATNAYMQAIREYLQLEYYDKKQGSTSVNEVPGINLKSYQPKLPQQANYTDCGLFVLEYAETFMRKPEFLMEHLKMENGFCLFKEGFVDEKRISLKRLVLAMMTGPRGQYVETGTRLGKDYREWRNHKYTYGKHTHIIGSDKDS